MLQYGHAIYSFKRHGVLEVVPIFLTSIGKYTGTFTICPPAYLLHIKLFVPLFRGHDLIESLWQLKIVRGRGAITMEKNWTMSSGDPGVKLQIAPTYVDYMY